MYISLGNFAIIEIHSVGTSAPHLSRLAEDVTSMFNQSIQWKHGQLLLQVSFSRDDVEFGYIAAESTAKKCTKNIPYSAPLTFISNIVNQGCYRTFYIFPTFNLSFDWLQTIFYSRRLNPIKFETLPLNSSVDSCAPQLHKIYLVEGK